MSARCGKTDLPVDQCAGACCRPDLKREHFPVGPVPARVRFQAGRWSKCDHCDGKIKPGQEAGYDADGGLVCERHLS